jgi:hypothetical protein
MGEPLLTNYTAFQTLNVDDFGDGRHLGRLPLDAPAEGFRYQKDVFFILPYNLIPEGGAIVNVTAEWTVQLRLNSNVGAPVMFEQTVRLPIQFIGLLGFAFWSPLTAQISVETSIVNGAQVAFGRYPGSTDPADPQTHRQGWQFVDVERPTEYSEQGLPDFDFSDTSSFNTLGALVNIRYYSAAYKQNVAPGYIFDAVRDTAGIGLLDKEATYRVSFRKTLGEGYWLDQNSIAHFARPATVGGFSGVEIHRRIARPGTPLAGLRARAFIPAVSQPLLAKTDDATLWLLARDRAQTPLLFRSADDGVTFTESGAVFGTGYNVLDIKPSPAGGTYQLAERDGTLYLQRFPLPWEQNRTVGTARAGASYRLGVLPGRTSEATIRVESADHAFISADEFSSQPQEVSV